MEIPKMPEMGKMTDVGKPPGHATLPAQQGEKVWVGECNVCKKLTCKTCPVCQLQFYCTPKHSKEDRKSHKRECKEKLMLKSKWKQTKTLDLEKDVLRVATEVFSEKYVSHDQKLGTWCIMPVEIKNSDGKKGYLVRVFEPQDPKLTLEYYKKKGFTKEMFYEIYSLSKAPLYHNAIILALKEMCVLYDVKLEFAGDPVTFYGTANVNVVSDFQPIELIYIKDDVDPSLWSRECLNTGHHTTLIIKTENFGRMLVDFTAPQYGIIEYNVDGTHFPVWICPEQKQKAYQIKELIFPSDVEATVIQLIKEPTSMGADNMQPDFFPIAVLSYKNALMQRIMPRKILEIEIESHPPSVKRVPLEEAVEKGWMS